ncbi:helix-loop-helix DNA-binding domain-containing protein [Xylariaceae sp. FL0594]|nr:helix-loop-helix DNA-binding domain-containing protein [Xylariaceae sp. FL0594]
MDARVMQDIDGRSSSRVNGAEPFLDDISSADFTQQFASTNLWDALEESSNSSFVHSGATSVAQHTPSSSANSPGSSPAAERPSSANHQSHKHGLAESSGPKKRRCSEESRACNRDFQDHSALDCSDYWLHFDSDEESPSRFFDYNAPNRKNVGPLVSIQRAMADTWWDQKSPNAAEPSTDAKVRSPTPNRPLIRTSTVGTTSINKVNRPSARGEVIDDSALDQALSDDDDMFSMNLAHELGKAAAGTSAPPPEAEERLYSTPLSWEPPRPGYHMNYVSQDMPLSEAERQRLLAIAMGTGAPAPQQMVRPSPIADFHFERTQGIPDAVDHKPEPTTRSPPTKPIAHPRKDSTETGEKPKEKPKNSERAAHNDIERKYRTNLKDKIAELRDAIPSLRSISEEDDANSLAGAAKTAPKVSKGTVLTKATEYIHQLERKNRSATQKNEELVRRLQAFEQLLGGAPASANWRPQQGYGGPVYNQRY